MFSAIFYFAGVQAAFLSITFFLKKGKILSNKIQAVWLSVLFVDLIAQGFFQSPEAAMEHPKLLLLGFGLPLLHGPFLFLYVKSITAQSRLAKSDYIHFLWFALFKLIFAPQLIMSAPELKEFLIYMTTEGDLVVKMMNYFITLHGLAFAYITYRQLRAHKDHVLQYYSNNGKYGLNWLRALVAMNVLIWLVVFSIHFLPYEQAKESGNVPIYLLVSVFIFITSYFALNHPVVFAEQWEQLQAPGKTLESSQKYAKTALSEEKSSTIKKHIEEYMAEKPWLEPELNIRDISMAIDFPIYQVSQVINDQFGSNLYMFINRYRVREVQEMLTNPELEDYSVLQVAFQCGFNSKSSFNAVFKEVTGKTPTQYKKETLGELQT